MVLGELMSFIGGAPTSAALMPPLPCSPWQAAHFCAKIDAPCAAVPLPFGSPLPSGSTLMSQAARSACESGWPRLGPAAVTVTGKAIPITSSFHSSVDMFHASARVDRPARRTVVVLARECQHRRRLRGLAAVRDDLRA